MPYFIFPTKILGASIAVSVQLVLRYIQKKKKEKKVTLYLLKVT